MQTTSATAPNRSFTTLVPPTAREREKLQKERVNDLPQFIPSFSRPLLLSEREKEREGERAGEKRERE